MHCYCRQAGVSVAGSEHICIYPCGADPPQLFHLSSCFGGCRPDAAEILAWTHK